MVLRGPGRSGPDVLSTRRRSARDRDLVVGPGPRRDWSNCDALNSLALSSQGGAARGTGAAPRNMTGVSGRDSTDPVL